MSGTVARSLGAMGDAMVGNANVNFDAGTLFIDSTNNRVGIGTASPQALFHIEQNFAGEIGHFVNNPNAGGYAAVRIGNSDRATNGDHLVYGSSVLGIRSKTGAAITFEPAGTERIRIDTSGNMGIGTNSPLARLDVVSSDRKRIRATGASEEGMILFQNGTTGTGASNGFLVGIGGDSNAYLLNYHNSSTIFHTNNTERMRLAANGNIGIGTSTPEYPVTINRGGGVALGLIGGGDLLFRNDAGTGSVQVYCDTNSEFKVAGSIAMGDPGSSASYISHGAWRGALDRAWDNYPSITIYNTTDRGPQLEFRIHGAGGANGGDISVTTRSDGGFVSGSDSRRKTDIQDIPNPLVKVLAITGKQYQVVNKDGEVENELSHSGKKIGFIGQEIIEVLPEVVKFYPEADAPTESGWASAYSIDYGSVTALLVEAIKEQQGVIQSLMTRLNALENK